MCRPARARRVSKTFDTAGGSATPDGWPDGWPDTPRPIDDIVQLGTYVNPVNRAFHANALAEDGADADGANDSDESEPDADADMSVIGMGVSADTLRRLTDKYEVQRGIGVRDSGRSYLAKRRLDKAEFAIKKIRTTRRGEPIESAMLEVLVTSRAQAPNLVGLLDIISGDAAVFMVTEYIPRTLDALIRAGPTKEDVVREYAGDIFSGLHFLHSLGYMHRDICPQTLLLTRDNIVKISDFSRSAFVGPIGSQYDTEVARISYCAPEVLLGKRDYCPQVDVWAASVVLCELLRGSLLFEGTDKFTQPPVIFRVLGTPTDDDWPGMSTLPSFRAFYNYPRRAWKDILKIQSPLATRFFVQALVCSPQCRLTVFAASRHPWVVSTSSSRTASTTISPSSSADRLS